MNRNKQKIPPISQILQWLPVAAAFILLPLFTGYRTFSSQIAAFPWSSGDAVLADLTLRCKQELFLFLTGCFVILAIWQSYQRKNEWKNDLRKQWHMLIPAGIYLFLAFVSSLCSDYRHAAFYGSDEQFESFFCLAGYLLFLLCTFLLIRREKDLEPMLGILTVLMSLLGILALLQYSGHDPFLTEWVQRLITPEGYVETYGLITNAFEEGRVSLCAYNPNYAGVLLATLAAFCLGMLLTVRKLRYFPVWFILFGLLIIGLIGTGSKAGLLVFALTALLALILFRKRILRHWRIFVPCLLVCFIGAGVLLYYARLPLLASIKEALSFEKGTTNPLTQMKTESDGVHVTYNGVSFVVSYTIEDDYFVLDMVSPKGTEFEVLADEAAMSYYPTDKRLENISFRPTLLDIGVYGLTVCVDGTDWTFLSVQNGYYYINSHGRPETLSEPERIGFSGFEHFASYRGLIWSQTLPLLKEHRILGSGANTFVFEYPQNNYKDMLFYMGYNVVVTRPHSMYLQTAVEAGIPAMIALMVFFALYLLQSLRLLWHSEFDSLSSRVSFACFLTVTTYLVCGLTNDSMITVAPVFFGILGIGLAANCMELKKR